MPVWELLWATANSSHLFGFSLTADNYPSLHNKFVVFSINIKTSGATVGYTISLNGVSTSALYSTSWTRGSIVFKFPTTGALNFSVRKIGAAGSIYVCAPVVTELGSNILEQDGEYKEQTVFFGIIAPTAGTWKVGDIVWDTNAAAGAAPGWMCTTAGAPGTWKAMANLAA